MILFLKKIYIPKLWGKLIKENKKKIGEIWLVSNIKNYETEFTNSRYKSIDFILKNNKELLFINNIRENNFKLLIKIILAEKPLSIQVHQKGSNFINKQYEGKQESWCILKTKKNNKLIFGHKAKTKAELEKNIKSNDWEKILNYISIRNMDVIDVPPGTIHSISSDTITYEIQQPSLITYRLYDFDRIDTDGKKRPLHIKESLNNIYYPQLFESKKENKQEVDFNTKKLLLDNDFYKLFLVKVKGQYKIETKEIYGLVTIIKGSCHIQEKKLEKYDTFLITTKSSCKIYGECSILIAQQKNY